MKFTCLFVATLALGACSKDTGILFEVSAEEGVGSVEALTVFVGFGHNGGISSSEIIIVNDQALNAETIDVSGRDLASEPYSVLVKPGDLGDLDFESALVYALAVGKVGEETVAVGFPDMDSATMPRFADGEVRKYRIVLSSGANSPDQINESCVRFRTPDGVVKVTAPDDKDCDGAKSADQGGDDCDDLNALVSPNKQEKCSNLIDDNCNGLIDQEDTLDEDDDGFVPCDPDPEKRDCAHLDATRYPGAPEVCDGVDNDCNSECDELDNEDGDERSLCGSLVVAVDDGSYCEKGPDEQFVDCQDKEARVYPGAAEVCDGLDNNCDGGCDDDPSFDADNDGWLVCAATPKAPDQAGGLLGYSCALDDATLVDCEDSVDWVNPGNDIELCDGYDTDCDGDPGDRENVEVFCLASDEGDCSKGKIQCDDFNVEAPLADECSPHDDDFKPLPYCEAYDQCLLENSEADEFVDNYECASQTVERTPVACTLNVYQGELIPCGEAVVELPVGPDAGNTTCSWFLGYDPSDAVSLVGDACQALLSIEGAIGDGVSFELWRFGPDEVFEVAIGVQGYEVCPEGPALVCNNGFAEVVPPN